MNSATHKVMLNSQSTTKMIITLHILYWYVRIKKPLQLCNLHTFLQEIDIIKLCLDLQKGFLSLVFETSLSINTENNICVLD